MPAGATGHVLIAAIVAISILLMLIRPRNLPEFYWIDAGVALLLLLRLMPLRTAVRAAASGADVYFFLFGMMLLAELAREHGVFEWVSSAAVRASRRSYARLFLLVYALGTVVTVFMSNDATAVVLTPAILAAVRKARVEPIPYLFACAFIANAASFVLPISNPANLVVFHSQVPPLAQWLLSFLFPSVISILVTYLLMRLLFRAELRQTIEYEVEAHPLTHRGQLVVAGLAGTAVVLLTASALNQDLGLPTCLAALAVTAVVSLIARRNPLPLARGISWGTLALVAGLFVMVDAVQSIGAMNETSAFLNWAKNLAAPAGAMVVGFVVGIGNNLVNNLPLGLLAGSTLRVAHVNQLIASSVLVGVDLGPNLSITGSLATILWLIALRRERLNVSFWSFFKIGAIVMPVSLTLSIGGILLARAFLAGN